MLPRDTDVVRRSPSLLVAFLLALLAGCTSWPFGSKKKWHCVAGRSRPHTTRKHCFARAASKRGLLLRRVSTAAEPPAAPRPPCSDQPDIRECAWPHLPPKAPLPGADNKTYNAALCGTVGSFLASRKSQISHNGGQIRGSVEATVLPSSNRVHENCPWIAKTSQHRGSFVNESGGNQRETGNHLSLLALLVRYRRRSLWSVPFSANSYSCRIVC